MSLPYIIVCSYLAIGLVVVFAVLSLDQDEDDRIIIFIGRGISAIFPFIFLLILALWPIYLLVIFFCWLDGQASDDRPEVQTKLPNQPPQRNAGSRPSSTDSQASKPPSSLGPRG